MFGFHILPMGDFYRVTTTTKGHLEKLTGAFSNLCQYSVFNDVRFRCLDNSLDPDTKKKYSYVKTNKMVLGQASKLLYSILAPMTSSTCGCNPVVDFICPEEDEQVVQLALQFITKGYIEKINEEVGVQVVQLLKALGIPENKIVGNPLDEPPPTTDGLKIVSYGSLDLNELLQSENSSTTNNITINHNSITNNNVNNNTIVNNNSITGDTNHIINNTFISNNTSNSNIISNNDINNDINDGSSNINSSTIAVINFDNNQSVNPVSKIPDKDVTFLPYVCQICDRAFTVSFALTKHTQKYHEPKRIDNGQEEQARQQKVSSSIIKVENVDFLEDNEPVERKCQKCSSTFYSSFDYEQHTCNIPGDRPSQVPVAAAAAMPTPVPSQDVVLMDSVKSFSCHVCNAKFTSVNNQRKHLALVHFSNQIKKKFVTNGLTCIVCHQQTFLKEENLLEHLAMHHNATVDLSIKNQMNELQSIITEESQTNNQLEVQNHQLENTKMAQNQNKVVDLTKSSGTQAPNIKVIASKPDLKHKQDKINLLKKIQQIFPLSQQQQKQNGDMQKPEPLQYQLSLMQENPRHGSQINSSLQLKKDQNQHRQLINRPVKPKPLQHPSQAHPSQAHPNQTIQQEGCRNQQSKQNQTQKTPNGIQPQQAAQQNQAQKNSNGKQPQEAAQQYQAQKTHNGIQPQQAAQQNQAQKNSNGKQPQQAAQQYQAQKTHNGIQPQQAAQQYQAQKTHNGIQLHQAAQQKQIHQEKQQALKATTQPEKNSRDNQIKPQEKNTVQAKPEPIEVVVTQDSSKPKLNSTEVKPKNQCPCCLQSFRSPKHLRHHIEKVHFKSNPNSKSEMFFNCRMCVGKTFLESRSMLAHLTKCHKPNSHSESPKRVSPAALPKKKMPSKGGALTCTRCQGRRAKRIIRCRACTSCQQPNCNKCKFCLTPSFRKPCLTRVCLSPIAPSCRCSTTG